MIRKYSEHPAIWECEEFEEEGKSPFVGARGVDQIRKVLHGLVRSLDFTLKIMWSHRRFLKRVVNR